MNFIRSNGCFLHLKYPSTLLFRYIARSNLCFQVLVPPQPEVYYWNSILKSFIESKNSECAFVIFRRMLESNVKPNDLTCSLLIKASITCSSILDSVELKQEAKQIHTHVLKYGFDRFVYVGTALLDLYGKCGCVLLAHQVFDDLPDRDFIAWNALICVYSYNGYDLEAVELFCEMLNQGMSPSRATLVSVIPSCAREGLLIPGKSIHGFGVKVGLDLDSCVKNALTDMYAKCWDLYSAELLFDEMSEKCVISWNTMINAYGQSGYVEKALAVFKQMHVENVGANAVTIVSLLSANAPLDSTHCYAVKTGLNADYSVITSLVCMYAKSGNVEMARLCVQLLPRKNLVSLTAIISCYAEKGDIVSAIGWFSQMQVLDLKPDAVAMVSILHGFTNSTHIEAGVSFHGYSFRSGLISDILVINGLINMYARLDYIDAAFSLFVSLSERPLISWNSVISSFVQAGRWNDAMELFWQMKLYGYNPDPTTMVSLLSGCSQFGSLKFGKKFHSYILRHNLEMEDFVLTSLVDMYAKCGSIEYAERVFKYIRNPCLATWNSIILGCGTCGFETEALGYFSEMVQKSITPDEITFLGVLSACNHAGLVHEGQKYFRMMNAIFGIIPGAQHCACMVDLLGRSGSLDEAVRFIKSMEVKPDSVIWLALLSACCVHQELKLAECVAKQILLLDHCNGGFYVSMSNLYASMGKWDDVDRVRQMMRDTGRDGSSGISSIESAFSEYSASAVTET